VSFSSPPALPDGGPESEPGPQPTLPGSPSWGDTDIGAAHAGPSMWVAPRAPAPADGEKLPTVGHIGRYALKYPIGSGGLGTVYAAHDPLLTRLIAIKTLNVEIPNEERPAFNALFLHEARAAAGLSHPHIVTVFDAGISEDGEDSRAYIAMELLKGRDLRQLREEGWRPTPAQSALIVRRVADALAYAHSKGIVHRDVKPANIFMVGRTQPRVLDFGIARVAHQHDGAGGPGDIAAGSPYYMSPEQVRQQPVDRRGDVFSLGVVLYELLTGRKPYTGANLEQITRAVLEHEPPMAHEIEPAVPKALSEIAARAMQKDIEERFRSARAFSRELRHWLDEQPSLTEAAMLPAPPAAEPAWQRWARPAAIATLVGAAAVIWLGLAGREPEPAGQAVATAAAAPAPADPAPTAAAPADAQATAPVEAPAGVAPLAADVVAAPAAPSAGPVLVAAAVATETVKPRPAPKPRTETRPAAKDGAADRTPAREARPAAVAATGTVHIAVSPWGEVEVDGRSAGTAPPLTELSLPEGRHQVTIRNADFPPHSATVTVSAGQPVTIKHRFGS